MADWIIIVDDDEMTLKLAGRILSSNGMKVSAFKSGRAMLDYIERKGAPDLVLLDIKMPEMDGFEVITKLKQIEKAKDVPVIFLTADENTGAEKRGLELGAMDFIRKPFVSEILILRVRHIIDLVQLQKKLANEVIEKTIEAQTDAMTGMLNKMTSENTVADTVSTSDGILLMIDLDNFKLVNDRFGHDMGDKVLVGFADSLKSILQDEDISGRIGGDEFIAFCKGNRTKESIHELTKKLNAEYMSFTRELMGDDVTDMDLGVSVGAVCIPEYGRDYEDVRKKADDALYSTKRSGKHGISFYTTVAPV